MTVVTFLVLGPAWLPLLTRPSLRKPGAGQPWRLA